MKAVEQFGYGTAQECMRWVDVPIPTPGPNQVLVFEVELLEVKAAQ